MEIEIKVSITPQQYIRLDNMARRMRRPMDKALGWMVTHHMDSILENTHISAPAGPKPIDWGVIESRALHASASGSYSEQLSRRSAFWRTKRKRLPDLAHRTSATPKGSPQATLILTESEEKSK